MKKGIRDRVAIIGTGVTKFGEIWEKDSWMDIVGRFLHLEVKDYKSLCRKQNKYY